MGLYNILDQVCKATFAEFGRKGTIFCFGRIWPWFRLCFAIKCKCLFWRGFEFLCSSQGLERETLHSDLFTRKAKSFRLRLAVAQISVLRDEFMWFMRLQLRIDVASRPRIVILRLQRPCFVNNCSFLPQRIHRRLLSVVYLVIIVRGRRDQDFLYRKIGIEGNFLNLPKNTSLLSANEGPFFLAKF